MGAMTRKIGILTPFLWTTPCGVNRQIESLVARLTARGHRVTVIAPSGDRQAVEEARRRVQAVLTGERETVFLPDEPYPRFFFAGATYAVRESRSLKLIAAPADLIANIDVLLGAEDLDLLHLHEPFVPGLGWTALRHAGCPLVATFHANPERMAPFLATRPKLRRLFDSLDAAIASSAATRDAAALAFPGAYRVIPPGIDLDRFAAGDGREPGPLRLLFAGVESRRKGLGVLLRALRLLEDRAAELSLEVCGAERQERRYARLVPPAFVGRVTFLGRVPDDQMPEAYRRADVYCAPSLGPETAAVSLLEAMAGGAVTVASRIPGYDEVVKDDVNGLLVPPRRPRALAAAIRRLLDDPGLRTRLRAEASRAVQRYDWERVAAETEDVYEKVAQRRRQPLPRRRRQQRELFADFHVHSHHSKDCVMPVPDILERAREVGLDVVAITDHDSAAGGLEAREIADRYGVRVIVGEEVKSSEGEVIGLFLERTIPGGMSFADTIAAIREQGGVVYVPHPFDRLHTIPAPRVLRANVADIDVMEVFNSRLAFPGFNELAEKFAQRYRIPAAAGSDAHVLPGIGTAMCGIDDFSGPGNFAAALTESRIVRHPRSLIYLQSLKFIQTTMGGQGRAAQDDSPA
jgi:glycosyltransferase involved in cell wall biosynthesis/predicted metal-dependent phosphoesterase TrpH